MPYIIEVTDIKAPELAPYASLTEAQLRSRQRPLEGAFIAESAVVIGHALDAGVSPVSFLMERKHITGKAAALLARCEGVPVYTADSAVLEKLTGYALTRGVLAAMHRPPDASLSDVLSGASRIAVLENIVDPTNVGAIFRSAAALGIDALLLTPSCCDPYNRRSLRVSMGTVFQLPWTRIGASPSDWPHPGMDALRSLGFRTAALALRDDAVSIADASLADIDRLALVLGTEGDGLSADTVAACDIAVRIPMSRGVDSLNVAAAGAVAFWAVCGASPLQNKRD